jgi:outer membrane lipoprotein-sorting protein
VPTAAADVSYGSIRLWLSRDDSVIRKYEFRDADGQVVKTLLLSDIRPVANIPSAHKLEMRNARTGSRTVVDMTTLTYNTGLADDVFTQRRLEKGVRVETVAPVVVARRTGLATGGASAPPSGTESAATKTNR